MTEYDNLMNQNWFKIKDKRIHLNINKEDNVDEKIMEMKYQKLIKLNNYDLYKMP